MRVDDLCGRRPGQLYIDKYEKLWNISNRITKHTLYRLIQKKMGAIEILQKYNYKVIDDSCVKESKSRLISMSKKYRNNWAPQTTNNLHKISTDLIYSPNDVAGIEPHLLLISS